ncbi:MAG: helix-turn-helix domain-containing protein [Thermoleophilaceae bacterium]|nr:helix-turn-helix domain-containing protein [Thermoleophilaceae bacterium]
MQHRNARLTPNGRYQMVRLVEERGFTFEAAAAASNVSKSTVWEWVGRWRRADAEARRSHTRLEDRCSRPTRSPRRLDEAAERRICAVRRRTGWGPRLIASETGHPHATVHRTLRRHGLSRRPAVPRETVLRYEWPCPGNLLHVDVKRFARFSEPGHAVTGDRTRRSRRAGWIYAHSVVDDCSRLAYTELHGDERAATVTAFTRRRSTSSSSAGSSPSA